MLAAALQGLGPKNKRSELAEVGIPVVDVNLAEKRSQIGSSGLLRPQGGPGSCLTRIRSGSFQHPGVSNRGYLAVSKEAAVWGWDGSFQRHTRCSIDELSLSGTGNVQQGTAL